MLSKKFVIVSALAVALGGGMAEAQKIAILDMQGAVLSTSDGKKAAQGIDAKFAPRKAEIDQLQKDLADRQDRLNKGGGAIKSAQAEIDSLTTTLKRKQEDAQQDLQDEENKVLGGIMPKLQQVINAYAAANQISVVVDSSANPNNLIYAEASVNITPAILAAYEKAVAAPADAAPASSPAAAPKAAGPSSSAPRAPATAPRSPASPRPAPKTTAPAK